MARAADRGRRRLVSPRCSSPAASPTHPLVWIGGDRARARPRVALRRGLPPLGRRSLALPRLLCRPRRLVRLSTLWSMSPDTSWAYTNRTLVYAAFATARRRSSALAASRALRRDRRRPRSSARVRRLGAAREVRPRALLRLRPRRASARAARRTGTSSRSSATPASRSRSGSHSRASRARGVGPALRGRRSRCCSRTRASASCSPVSPAVAWVLLDGRVVEGIVALVVGGAAGAAVFGVALALPGITSDGQSRAVARARRLDLRARRARRRCGSRAALARLLAQRERPRGRAAARVERASRRSRARARARRGHRVVGVVFAGRIWHEFTNPVDSADRSNSHDSPAGARRATAGTWWQEAWHAFTAPSARRHRRGHVRAHRPPLPRQTAITATSRTTRRCSSSARPASSASCSSSACGGRALRRRAGARVRTGGARARSRLCRVPRAHGRRQGLELRRRLRAAPASSRRARRSAARRRVARARRPLLAVGRARVRARARSTRSPRRGSRSAQSCGGERRGPEAARIRYDPLSHADVLTDSRPTFDDARARQAPSELLRDALSLEPDNANLARARARSTRDNKAWKPRVPGAQQGVRRTTLRAGRAPCGVARPGAQKALGTSGR